MGEPVAARADHGERAGAGGSSGRAHRQPMDLGSDARRVEQLDQPGDQEAGVARILGDLEGEAARPGHVDVA